MGVPKHVPLNLGNHHIYRDQKGAPRALLLAKTKLYSCTKQCTTGLPDGAPKALLRDIDFLQGHGDLVSRLMMGIFGVIIRLIEVIILLTKSP